MENAGDGTLMGRTFDGWAFTSSLKTLEMDRARARARMGDKKEKSSSPQKFARPLLIGAEKLKGERGKKKKTYRGFLDEENVTRSGRVGAH